jgi:Carboxypeptidase regulatory-like domain/TonB dependent receptor-like, beta-barrel
MASSGVDVFVTHGRFVLWSKKSKATCLDAEELMRGVSLVRAVCSSVLIILAVVIGVESNVDAQGLGGAGTVQGIVKDPTGAVMVAVPVTLANPVTGFNRQIATGQDGRFVFRNVPPNSYHLEVATQGFQPLERDVDVRTAVPIELELTLALAMENTNVQVVGHATDLTERDPVAHTDIDQSLVATLPLEPTSTLNQVVTLASPGVVADANGFFHPMGDHAQSQFSIDNQPVTDQQSRIYSNQISTDAVQSMEVINGVPPAEFGDKDSLVVRIVTKSGLDQPHPTGAFNVSVGSFSTPVTDIALGAGSPKFGNFVSFNGLRTDRFLDPPEFTALHGTGNSESFFDRLDAHPSDANSFHLNVHLARSSFDVPNTFDQDAAGQDQHQKITTFNIAPGYSRILNSSWLLTANGYVRQDKVGYRPSEDPFADQPGTASQDRRLTNVGVKVDLAYARGIHNVKFGGSVGATKLKEQFSLGLTDPTVNSPCLDADGSPSGDPSLISDDACDAAELAPNADFIPGLVPYDLSRGGGLFQFAGDATIKQQAFYIQDDLKVGNNATVGLGLRFDHYDGLTTKSLVEPRIGFSYALAGGRSIFRASYGRTLETPYNENLILSNNADPLVFGTSGQPLSPGTRDHVEVGFQQAFGGWVVADVGYFYKHTTNAYDFGVLFDTPIFFPVSWDHSKLDGVTARINLIEHKGFSAFTVMGHTNAIFSPPGTGGLLLEQPEGEFRIDHDQKFQQTTNLQYTFEKTLGAWAAFSWRYDSGLVAGSVPDYATALTLSSDQQAAIGLFCGSTVATLDAPITSCDQSDRGAKRLVIPADGTADDLHNPPRVAPRNLFDLGIGVNNLFHTDKAKVRVRFTVVNLANTQALYNFLSTFSGTHFVTPRAYQVQAGVTF